MRKHDKETNTTMWVSEFKTILGVEWMVYRGFSPSGLPFAIDGGMEHDLKTAKEKALKAYNEEVGNERS